MNKPTFKEQSEKIIQAYLKCEIDPFDNCACFVGNLLNNRSGWFARDCGKWNRGKVSGHPDYIKRAIEIVKKESGGLYSLEEVLLLEKKFLDTIDQYRDYNGIQTEDGLFKAMILTLEMLKQLHLLKGEVIEEEITLQKRELV